ncbi:uncharacterized protein LOC144914305 [Branchiostoma floridae x Branchiostoma belcheri]
MYVLAVLLVLSGPAQRLVLARGESHAATAGDSHHAARGESHAGESHHAPARGDSHYATDGDSHAAPGDSHQAARELHAASAGELGHIGPEDWLRNFTNATEQRDFEKLQHLLTYVVEKAGDKTLDQDILASLKVMQSVGYVNRNATYWDELNLQVKQIMYQLGLEREPQTPRKRAKKTRRRGPRMSNHRSHVEL